MTGMIPDCDSVEGRPIRFSPALPMNVLSVNIPGHAENKAAEFAKFSDLSFLVNVFPEILGFSVSPDKVIALVLSVKSLLLMVASIFPVREMPVVTQLNTLFSMLGVMASSLLLVTDTPVDIPQKILPEINGATPEI